MEEALKKAKSEIVKAKSKLVKAELVEENKSIKSHNCHITT